MITATVNTDAVKKKLAYIIDDMPTAVAIGVNSTAKKARNESAKALKKAMGAKVPLKVVRSAVRAKAVASKSHLAAIVSLQSGYPISLRYFNPKWSKKRGASVQLDRFIKGKAGRTLLPNAFISKRLGGKVFERAGKSRLPIKEQFGPSPGQFIKVAYVKELAVNVVRTELKKRIERRIRFLLLKQSGGLRGRQPTN